MFVQLSCWKTSELVVSPGQQLRVPVPHNRRLREILQRVLARVLDEPAGIVMHSVLKQTERRNLPQTTNWWYLKELAQLYSNTTNLDLCYYQAYKYNALYRCPGYAE